MPIKAQNEKEAAYIGLAIVDELMNALLKKQIISEDEADDVLKAALAHLRKGSSADASRAAETFTSWYESRPKR